MLEWWRVVCVCGGGVPWMCWGSVVDFHCALGCLNFWRCRRHYCTSVDLAVGCERERLREEHSDRTLLNGVCACVCVCVVNAGGIRGEGVGVGSTGEAEGGAGSRDRRGQ